MADFPQNAVVNGIIAFVLVVGATVLITSGLELNMDIRFYDESYYLTQGRFWPVSSWEADYSPLYSLYYKGLSWFEADPFQLYYLNYRVWSVVFGLCAFGVLRAFGTNLWLSWIWAVLAVCSELNLPLWPKAGHFAFLFVSMGLIGFQWLKKNRFSFLCLSTIGLFILSWARPEFFLGGVVGTTFILIFWLRGSLYVGRQIDSATSVWKQLYVSIFPVLIIAITFLIVWGLPVGRSGRGLVAFGQHFAHNWHYIQGKPGNVLLDWINWRDVFYPVFGSADGLVSAFLANPGVFAQHLWFNAKYLFYNSFILFAETLLPHRIFHFSIAVLATILLGFCEWLHDFNGLARCFRKSAYFLKVNGFYLFPLAISSLAAGLLFQPRPHYILPILPFFWAFSARLSKEYTFPKIGRQFKPAIRAALLASALLFLPKATSFFEVSKVKGDNEMGKEREAIFKPFVSSGLKGKALVNSLISLPVLKGKRVFDGSSGVLNYLGQTVTQKGKVGFEFDYPGLKPFSEFLKRERIEVVYLAGSMKYDHFFEKDPFYQSLKAKPEAFGWRKLPLNASTDSLLVRIN